MSAITGVAGVVMPWCIFINTLRATCTCIGGGAPVEGGGAPGEGGGALVVGGGAPVGGGGASVEGGGA